MLENPVGSGNYFDLECQESFDRDEMLLYDEGSNQNLHRAPNGGVETPAFGKKNPSSIFKAEN